MSNLRENLRRRISNYTVLTKIPYINLPGTFISNSYSYAPSPISKPEVIDNTYIGFI